MANAELRIHAIRPHPHIGSSLRPTQLRGSNYLGHSCETDCFCTTHVVRCKPFLTRYSWVATGIRRIRGGYVGMMHNMMQSCRGTRTLAFPPNTVEEKVVNIDP